jgi:putative spermidine/putrescine transport system permease protein
MSKYTKPAVDLVRFVLPLMALAGAALGFLVGTANGVSLLGAILGAVCGVALSWVLASFVPSRRTGILASTALFAVAGVLIAGPAGIVGGLIVGFVLSWLSYWLFTGSYRAGTPIYATPGQVLWHNTFKFICGAIFFFLIAPILTIIPLSFNAENFFTFTPAMLLIRPRGLFAQALPGFLHQPGLAAGSEKLRSDCSGGHPYLGFAGDTGCNRPVATACAVPAGNHGDPDFTDDRAADHFRGRHVFLLLAHRPAGHLCRRCPCACGLGIPFVIITVTATLVGFDKSLTRAAANMGADPVTTFFRVQMPLILPGVISGGLFAFITSFDEVVVVLFVGSAGQKTLPWQMFTGLREQISPTILAVATILVVISIMLLTVVELLRRRSERLRGLSPG